MENQSQYLNHFPITSWPFHERRLEALEAIGKFSKGSAVPQRTGLALQDRKVMPPVVNGVAEVMPAVDDSLVFGNDVAFSSNHQMIGIDPQADRPIGKRGRDAITVTFEVDQTGR